MRFVSGKLFEYYHICKRKTWYFANGISMEEENENVQIGQLIDETSYQRERKHILIDEKASVDFMKDSTVYEIKKSSSQKEAAVAQIQYYLYLLKQKGVDATGELRIPKENRIEAVSLTEAEAAQVEATITSIEKLIDDPQIPSTTEKVSICKKCAFYELCFI